MNRVIASGSVFSLKFLFKRGEEAGITSRLVLESITGMDVWFTVRRITCSSYRKVT